MCGLFQASITEQSPEHCFKSTLNVTASLSLDGVEVTCEFVHGTQTRNRIGGDRITLIGEDINTYSS